MDSVDHCLQPLQVEVEEESDFGGFELCLLHEQQRLLVLAIQALEKPLRLRVKRGKETA